MIRVEGLSKSFGPTPAISDLTFSVARGEILGFLGPNGAGKTTTMRILTGFMPPAQGRVTIDGLDAARDALAIRRRVGYLPESVPVYREPTVRDYLGFVADVKGVPRRGRRAAIDRVLEQCGLSDVSHRIVGRLSRGYRQRVGLAQALVNEPSVLVLDEPTVGLDPGQVVEIRELIRGLGGRTTILLSSHILPEVSAVCGRVLILNRGRIVAEGTPDELTRRMSGGATWRVRVSGEGTAARARLEALPGVRGVAVEPGGRGEPGETVLRVDTDGADDRRGDLARAVVASGDELLELAPAGRSLEEIFLALVGPEGGG
jgi:ABC-2 type transport system ATP-binding protein